MISITQIIQKSGSFRLVENLGSKGTKSTLLTNHQLRLPGIYYARSKSTATAALGSMSPEPSHPNWSAEKLHHVAHDTKTIKLYSGEASYQFHGQWLYDSKCDNGPSKTAASAICESLPGIRISEANLVVGPKDQQYLDVAWSSGENSRIPIPWLRAMGSIVAKTSPQTAETTQTGWLAQQLRIPKVSYKDIIAIDTSEGISAATALDIFDELLHKSAPGIIKVTDLPPPDLAAERNKSNTIVTQVLKKLFGSVFVHPVRGTDKTFNVASHHNEDTKRGRGLSNYNTNQVLLPHVDHAHYHHPIRVQGWYGLEGVSENTFVSPLAALNTLKSEQPDLVEHLLSTPMGVGRLAEYYDPPMNQATAETAVIKDPVSSTKIKRFRWHPHLVGSLLAPCDKYDDARRAHQAFQEILRRDTHLLKVILNPGDLYIWDNFRILHGRERVLETPRTGVGQTVPEQIVDDRYRAMLVKRLKNIIDEAWLVQTPTPQLRDILNFVQ